VPAQTFQVVYAFTGGQDGSNPTAGVTIDQAGNLYGTATFGSLKGDACGEYGCGTVYRLKRYGSGFVFIPIYTFMGPNGAFPQSRVVFGSDGALYGTTAGGGGNGYGNGTVFSLQPQPTPCKSVLCPWDETLLYQFIQLADGDQPGYGDLAFDQAGNVYGTTTYGGHDDGPECSFGCGVVYQVAQSGGGWTETVLHEFLNDGDGILPIAGVIFGSDGNLYGTATAQSGGDYEGTVYELTPSASGWAETTLQQFVTGGAAGSSPVGGLIFDNQGNLYGTTDSGGAGGAGTVFEMSPYSGNWQLNVLWSLLGNGYGTFANLTMDAAGNLYGTGYKNGAHGYGYVFKLTSSSGGWTFTDLHDFTGGSDGSYPTGNVSLDANGNLYGTTSSGGNQVCDIYEVVGCGVVWEITP
jgi:uncharacterized repeat protein (TIGR03803 family)